MISTPVQEAVTHKKEVKHSIVDLTLRFPKRKELRLTGSRVPRKADFPKRKESLLKKIDSDKKIRGQLSVRNFPSYFINYLARENFIKKQYINDNLKEFV